jgi:molecular chaperone GrpE
MDGAMTDHDKQPETPEIEAAEAQGGPAAANDNPAEAIARLEQEKAELKDRLLRTLADLENQRRRAEREVADARSYAISKFAGDMLGVADNMGRALAALPADARDNGDPTLKALLEGAEMTEREMLRALEKHGVKKIDPKGERFDPHRHQAIFEVPDPAVPAGTVAQVVQVGYSIGDRVLRPAMVGVARGGPKAGAAAEAGASVDKTA